MSKNGPEQVVFWEERYRQQQMPWDLSEPAPPFVAYLKEPDAPRVGKLLVPGCGRGHDALFFARQGLEVTGIDFAPAAIEACRQQAQAQNLDNARFELQDIFELGKVHPQTFDFVAEHTCFCAIDPSRRPEYIQMVRQVLRPRGQLVAIFFVHGREGGPPFTTSATEIEALFGPFFEIERLEKPKQAHPSRQGEELFGVLTLRD